MDNATWFELEGNAWNAVNPHRCPCRGSGWMLSDFDTHHVCRTHGNRNIPHPEEENESFDWSAHYVTVYRTAYRIFQKRSGMSKAAFREAVEAKGHFESKVEWVDAAEEVSDEARSEALHARAVKMGFSCRLEASLAAEGRLEAEARSLNMDPDVYATSGSPERAEADSWY
jgi:hypothetical protein